MARAELSDRNCSYTYQGLVSNRQHDFPYKQYIYSLQLTSLDCFIYREKMCLANSPTSSFVCSKSLCKFYPVICLIIPCLSLLRSLWDKKLLSFSPNKYELAFLLINFKDQYKIGQSQKNDISWDSNSHPPERQFFCSNLICHCHCQMTLSSFDNAAHKGN